MFGAWPWACRIPMLRRSIILPGLPFVREWLCGKFVVDLCCHLCWHSGFSAYHLFFLLYSCFLNYALWYVMQCSCHVLSSPHHNHFVYPSFFCSGSHGLGGTFIHFSSLFWAFLFNCSYACLLCLACPVDLWILVIWYLYFYTPWLNPSSF